MSNKKRWPELFIIVENTNKEGEKFKSVKFSDNVVILNKGEEVEMPEKRYGKFVDNTDESKSWLVANVMIGDVQVASVVENNGKRSINIPTNIDFVVDGDTLDLTYTTKDGKTRKSALYRTVRDEFESLKNNGHIKEEELESREARAKEIASWLKGKAIAPING